MDEHLVPYIVFLLMQNNTRPHNARMVQNWDMLGRRLRDHLYRPNILKEVGRLLEI